MARIGQTVYSSATRGPYELARSHGVVEQIIRPIGLVDAEVVLKPTPAVSARSTYSRTSGTSTVTTKEVTGTSCRRARRLGAAAGQ